MRNRQAPYRWRSDVLGTFPALGAAVALAASLAVTVAGGTLQEVARASVPVEAGLASPAPVAPVVVGASLPAGPSVTVTVAPPAGTARVRVTRPKVRAAAPRCDAPAAVIVTVPGVSLAVRSGSVPRWVSRPC